VQLIIVRVIMFFTAGLSVSERCCNYPRSFSFRPDPEQIRKSRLLIIQKLKVPAVLIVVVVAAAVVIIIIMS